MNLEMLPIAQCSFRKNNHVARINKKSFAEGIVSKVCSMKHFTLLYQIRFSPKKHRI